MPASHEPAMSADAVAAVLDAAVGGRWQARPLHASGFADTWQAWRGGERLFVKTARAGGAAPLRAEADGLAALAATGTVRVPAVAACTGAAPGDAAAGGALLALEWLDLRPPDAGFGARLGRSLGALHRAPVDLPRFGWRRDNFIGATPQCNRATAGATTADWIAFVGDARLGAMRDRLAAADPARRQARLCQAVDAVIAALPRFFDGGAGRSGAHAPRPSLIHGDLWGGNWGMLGDGTPVVYDPAVSVSDAEAELAMMELFGAPPPGFWPAYREAAGMHPGYAARRGLYQLYHLLNHALLFGGGYARQAMDCAQALAAAAR